MFDEHDFYDEDFSTEQLEEIDETAGDIMQILEGKDLSICYEAMTICYEILEEVEKEQFLAMDTRGLNGYDANKYRSID